MGNEKTEEFPDGYERLAIKPSDLVAELRDAVERRPSLRLYFVLREE